MPEIKVVEFKKKQDKEVDRFNKEDLKRIIDELPDDEIEDYVLLIATEDQVYRRVGFIKYFRTLGMIEDAKGYVSAIEYD